MTRILIASDIHTEFGRLGRLPPLPSPDDYDVVLLAGDISAGPTGILWATETFPDKPIVMLNGNHEYYHFHMEDVKEAQQRAIADVMAQGRTAPIHLLDPGVVEIGNVVIIGATLWTNLELKGVVDHRVTDLYYEQAIADFKLTYNHGERRTCDDHRLDHAADRAAITEYLEEYKDFGKKIVVATHFVPSQLCIDPIYLNSPINPYFTVDMDDLMLDHSIDTWFFGHTHSKISVEHPSGTKLICNPAGYPGEHDKFSWDIYNF